MTSRVGKIVTMAIAISTLALAAREAVGAQSALRKVDCGDGNWCAPSHGGQTNCDDCCNAAFNTLNGGFCFSFEEDPAEGIKPQGCLCY